MILTTTYAGKKHKLNLSRPISLCSTVRSGDDNPNCYFADAPYFEVIREGDFIGSVAEGGTVNHRKLHITPHGNGTHTECYGHITGDPEATIDRCLTRFHFLATVVHVKPKELENGDQVIGWDEFSKKLGSENIEAVIARTDLGGEELSQKKWSGTNPPYFDPEVGEKMAALGILHLVTDLPSVDREVDGGALAMHRAFWQTHGEIRKSATITELAAIPATLTEGAYLLELQVPSIRNDAAPSRPVLYELIAVD